MRFDSILDAIGDTPLVGISRLSPSPSVRLWAKLEGQNPTGSTKDRIALAMVEAAEASGELTADKTILEPTSGNTGIALAMVSRRKGYALTVVIPDNASEERIGLLRLFGAEIVFSDGAQGHERVDRGGARPRERRALLHAVPVREPREPGRARAGDGAGDHPRPADRDPLRRRHGHRRHLTGTGRRLHAHDPNVKVIAAEPELGDLVYGLRSLDDGFIPPIFDPAQIDRKFLVNSADSLRATRELTAREGIFAGISSGAVIHVAQRVAQEVEQADIVCLLPDGGWKYLSTQAWAEDLTKAEQGVEESLWW